MSDERQTITKATVKALVRLIGREEREVRDPACAGLSIRVRKRDGVWTLRGRLLKKQNTWRIGSITDDILAEPAAARARAEEAKRLLARGLDPADWLRAQENRGEVIRTGDPKKDGWTFAEASVAFLTAKTRNRSPKTIEDYRKSLRHSALKPLMDLPLKALKGSDVREAMESIIDEETGAKTAQANHLLRVVKSMLSWASQEARSGVQDVIPVTVRVKPKELVHRPGYVPSLPELGSLFWKLDGMAVHPSARLAAALIVLTAQRREAVASARVSNFEPLEGMPGWGLWQMPPDHRQKLDRFHAIPLPPLAWGLVRLAKMNAGASEFLFPQVRERRKGQRGAGHLSGKAVYDVLRAAGGGELTPHDLRRALASHGPTRLRIRDDDLKKVLNHAHGKQDVTAKYYALHESMPWKVDILGAWEGMLVELMQRHAPNVREWPCFLPTGDEPIPAVPLMLAAE